MKNNEVEVDDDLPCIILNKSNYIKKSMEKLLIKEIRNYFMLNNIYSFVMAKGLKYMELRYNGGLTEHPEFEEKVMVKAFFF